MSDRIQVFGVERGDENAARFGGGLIRFEPSAIPAAAVDRDIDANTNKARREFLDVSLDPAKNGRDAFLSDHDDFHSNDAP
jgi:hypothetical protein